MYGVDLDQRFYAASEACIVMFRTLQLWPDQVSSALWYAYAKLRGNGLTSNSLSCFDGGGVPVPAKRVVGVEVVTAR